MPWLCPELIGGGTACQDSTSRPGILEVPLRRVTPTPILTSELFIAGWAGDAGSQCHKISICETVWAWWQEAGRGWLACQAIGTGPIWRLKKLGEAVYFVLVK